MTERFARRPFPHHLERNEVVDCRFAEHDVVFHERRHLVPLRLFPVTERPAVAQPVKERDRRDKGRRVRRILRGALKRKRIPNGRQREKPLRREAAER